MCFGIVDANLSVNFTIFSRKKPNPDEVILKEIQKCANTVNSSIIEQTAYIRASADKKNLDLSKYKDEIQKEMDKKNDEQGIFYLNLNLSLPILHLHLCMFYSMLLL